MKEPGRLLTITEVLETVLPIGRSLLYREIRAGRLQIVKIGRRTLVTTDALDQYVATLSDRPEPLRRNLQDRQGGSQ